MMFGISWDDVKDLAGQGPGGVILILLCLAVLLLVVMGVLAGIAQLAGAFAKGWRSAGPDDQTD